MRRFSSRLWWVFVAVSGAVVIIIAVMLWPDGNGHSRSLPPTRARAYASWRACMVTGPAGLADPQAGAVWKGMEQASAKTSAKISYLAATGNGSAAQASTFVATAAGEQCDLVIAVGAPQVQGLMLVAQQFPRTRFAVVGAGAEAADIVRIPTADADLSSAVAFTVESDFHAGPLAGTSSAASCSGACPADSAS